MLRALFYCLSVLLVIELLRGQALAQTPKPQPADRPNVIIILADDLGYGDLGYTGSPLAQTPHLDAFAKNNLVFTAGYAPSPQCSPTRASILTGQYPARLHITTWIGGEKAAEHEGLLLPEQRQSLPDDIYTIAEYFQSRDYQTVQIGKWHLGSDPDGPRQHGFDRTIGFAAGAGPSNKPIEWFGPYPGIKDLTGPEDEYITDRLTTEAVRVIKDRGDRPFFMMLQHYDVHAPLSAPKADIEKYVAMGRPLDKGKDNATYLAMKERVDDSVGRVLAALEEQGLSENTIVIFTSDNGAVEWFGDNGPYKKGKKRFYEGGIRVPLIIRVPGLTPGGGECHTPVNGIDFFPTLVELSGGTVADLPTVLDGVSIVPLLRGEPTLARDTLFWHHPAVSRDYALILPQGVVRHGDYKLVHYYGELQPDELYNLESDPTESRNIAGEHAELVSQMREMLDQHLTDTDAQRVLSVR